MIKLYLLFVIAVLTVVVIASRWLPVWGAAILIPGSVAVLIWLTLWLIRSWFRSAVARGIAEATRVLEGASVVVHSCHSVPEPEAARRTRETEPLVLEGEEDDELLELGELDDPIDDEDEPTRWVSVEVTIVPSDSTRGPQVIDPENPPEAEEPLPWEANSFLLVPGETPSFDPKRDGLLKMASVGPQASVHRFERLDDSGTEVLLDTDDYLDADETYDAELPPGSVHGEARVRLTFGVPAGLNGSVKLRYLTLDLAELVLPAR